MIYNLAMEPTTVECDRLWDRSNRSLATSWKNKNFKRSFASKELLELVNDWAHDVIVLSKFFV